MGVDTRGYDLFYTRQITAGSDAATIVVFPDKTARVDVVQMNGSPAFIAFDSFGTLTPYNGIGSGTNSWALATVSGNSVTYPIRTGSIQIIGSAGSPIGASTSTLKITAWY
jgi:hypothetical protein